MNTTVIYDASFAVNNYRGMGVFVNALKDVISQYDSIDITGVCNCKTSDAGVKKIGTGLYPVWEQVSLPLYLKKNKCDMFIFPYNTMPLLVPKHLKKILVLHDVIFLEKMPGSSYSLKQWGGKLYRKLLVANAYKKADSIITVSEYSKKRMQELLGKRENIYVIPSLVKDELKKIPAGIDVPDGKYFLSIGGEAPSKNILSLVKAYISLPKEIRDNYKLKLVGNYSKIFIKKAYSLFPKGNNDSNGLEFTGFIDDQALIQLYRASTLVIFPSLYEGFGLPAIEALAFERPLLASNAASIPEVAGEGALYFNPLSVDDMRNKIEFALSKKYKFESYKQHYKEQLEKFAYKSFTERVKKFVEAEILDIKQKKQETA